jgi:hypothetical protein
MYRFKLSLVALASLALLTSLALLVVTLTHSLAPVGAAPADKGPRKFYLTRTFHTGAQALSACAGGYHMASLWEILDPSNLRYDTGLGFTTVDSGFGPPDQFFGWIRTGGTASVVLPAGDANCNAWTEAGELKYGTSVLLFGPWNSPSLSGISPWGALAITCSSPIRVWCVED